MDIVRIIKELRGELERIDALILALERLQIGRKRGRPPKLLQQLRSGEPSRRAKKGKKKARKKKARKGSKTST